VNNPAQQRGRDESRMPITGRSICETKKVAGKCGFINSGWRYKCGKTGNHAADISPAIKAYNTMAAFWSMKASPRNAFASKPVGNGIKPLCR
jgi:hypothetical protein